MVWVNTVIFSIDKDLDVALLELKMVGLREFSDLDFFPKLIKKIEEVEREVIPLLNLKVRANDVVDLLMDDRRHTVYAVRIYVQNNRAKLVVVVSTGPVRGLVRRLEAHGWRQAFLLELRRTNISRRLDTQP